LGNFTQSNGLRVLRHDEIDDGSFWKNII